MVQVRASRVEGFQAKPLLENKIIHKILPTMRLLNALREREPNPQY